MDIDVAAYYAEHVDQALSGNYTVHGDREAADCVIAVSFGYIEKAGAILPGQSNAQLARFTYENFPSLPKIMQFEVADAYLEFDTKTVYRIEASRQPDQRLDTPEVILQAKQLMKDQEWQTAVLIAHPNHMPWVDFLCSQADITTVAPHGLQIVGFDGASAQYWTRSLMAWQKEVQARHTQGNPREIAQE